MVKPDDVYAHGHHPSVLRSHTTRTAENSAAHLIPHLYRGADLLDVGCGPGTISVDLAERVFPGEVHALDRSADVIEHARELNRSRSSDALEFRVGDAYAIDLPDASKDIIHAHQVLQHLSDPVSALREWRRVVRPGGIVAARDSDYGSFAWAPNNPLLDRWMALYQALARTNGAEPDAGRYLLGWAQSAGFTDVTATSSTWTFAEPESRAWWGDLWAERVLHSSFREQSLALGLTDESELERIAATWRDWAAQEDGFFMVPHGEIIARR